MSKPIKLTDELLKKIQDEFTESVRNMKMFDGKISYTKHFKWEDSDGDRAYVTFDPVAFAKMVMLLQHFDSEVAWHGVAYRDKEQVNLFRISDIIVYPQVVSGSTVNTDQEKYQEWLYGLDDEQFNNLRMQGHSHVNLSTTPSGVDTTHQEKILDQLDDDMFYIFMIWNKKFERTIKIYDMLNNTLYDNDDVKVYIGNEGIDLDAFIKRAKDVAKPKYQYAYNPSSTGVAQQPVTTQHGDGAQAAGKGKGTVRSKPKGKEKPVIGMGWRGNQWDDDNPYDSYMERFMR